MGKFKFSVSNLILCLLFSAGNLTAQNDRMLLGDLVKEDFLQSPYNIWFSENYQSYEIDKQTLNDIFIQQDDLSFLVFLGSWCGDTKREFPRFLKIIEHLAVPDEKIRLIGLDRTKKAPVYTENIWNIEYVPTFIVLKNGFEIGRITEQPVISLEEDLKQIIGLKYIEKAGQVLLRNGRKTDSVAFFGDCDMLSNASERVRCSELAINKFFKDNMIKTINSGIVLKGKATVNFVVDKDGRLRDIQVRHAGSKATETEAFRLVNQMNHSGSGWKPALKKGFPIAVRQKCSINFDRQ